MEVIQVNKIKKGRHIAVDKMKANNNKYLKNVKNKNTKLK